jgi:hypothetical protein
MCLLRSRDGGRKLKVTGFKAGDYEPSISVCGWETMCPILNRSHFRSCRSFGAALAIVVSLVFAVIVLAIVWKGIKVAKGGESGGVLD